MERKLREITLPIATTQSIYQLFISERNLNTASY